MEATAKLKPDEELLIHLDMQARERARTDFLSFIQYTMPEYQANWHHRYTAKILQDWAEGRIKKLILIEPPQNGKSQQVSRHLPAWIFGALPGLSVIGATYAQDYATFNNNEIQNIMDSPAYQRVFPGVVLPGSPYAKPAARRLKVKRDQKKFDVLREKGGKYYKAGSYLCAGVGGGITGNPAKRAIIDDYFKSAAVAYSPTQQKALWQWWTTVLLTRLHNDSSVLVTATPWHHKDLIGRILERDKRKEWKVVRLEAIKDKEKNPADPRKQGEPLWPERFSKRFLDDMKHDVGSFVWSAMYQGHPTPDEGGIVKRHWFNYWSALPTKFDEIIQSWDLTFKKTVEGSKVVGHVWGFKGAQKYLLDRVSGRMEFTESCTALKNLTKKWPEARKKLIENKANGPALESALKKTVSGIILVEPEGGKEARLRAAAATIEAGDVFLPMPSRHPWVEDVITEICGFPNAPQDDEPDVLSQAIIYREIKQGNFLFRIARG